jgi:hypothetical protein
VVVPPGMTSEAPAADLVLHFPLRHWYGDRLHEVRATSPLQYLSEADWHQQLVQLTCAAFYQDVTFSLRSAAERAGVLVPPPASLAAAAVDPRAPTFDLGLQRVVRLDEALSIAPPSTARLLANVLVDISRRRSEAQKAAKQAKAAAAAASSGESTGAAGGAGKQHKRKKAGPKLTREQKLQAKVAAMRLAPNIGVGLSKPKKGKNKGSCSPALWFGRPAHATVVAQVMRASSRSERRHRPLLHLLALSDRSVQRPRLAQNRQYRTSWTWRTSQTRLIGSRLRAPLPLHQQREVQPVGRAALIALARPRPISSIWNCLISPAPNLTDFGTRIDRRRVRSVRGGGCGWRVFDGFVVCRAGASGAGVVLEVGRRAPVVLSPKEFEQVRARCGGCARVRCCSLLLANECGLARLGRRILLKRVSRV